MTVKLSELGPLLRTEILRRGLDPETIDLDADTINALVSELRSKEACPSCGDHKLYTNDSEKEDSITRWHCLNCNHTFYEKKSRRDFCKEKETPTLASDKSFQRHTSSAFWDKADLTAVIVIGGISIGAALAQLPGVIIGGLCGAGYGWYVSFSRDRSS